MKRSSLVKFHSVKSFFLMLFIATNSHAINFGGVGAKLGKELQDLNPFALNTPERRADDFYSNATKKEFDCLFGSRWIKLSDGYLTVQNIVVGEVRKLSKGKQLLVILHNEKQNFTCSIDDRDWNNGSAYEMSACLFNGRPLLMCKRSDR